MQSAEDFMAAMFSARTAELRRHLERWVAFRQGFFTEGFYLLLISLACGCASEKTSEFKPIENGFGYVTHVKGIMDQSLSAGLCYQSADGSITGVWPYLQIVSGNNIVISNKTALLIGGKAELYKDGIERLTKRLIAFQAPSGPPLDITEQVLEKWSAQSGFSITNYIKDTFASLTKTNGAIQLDFVYVKYGERSPGSVNAHGTTIVTSWHEIEAILQDVRKNGVTKREKRSGVDYLQKN